MYRAEIMTYYAYKSIPDTQLKQQQTGKEDDIPFFANLARSSLSKADPLHKTDHKLYETLSGIIFRDDKERYLCYQELPLILAHFEAFLGRTLTAIWESDSSMLEGDSSALKWLEQNQKTLGQLGPEEFADLTEYILYEIFRKSYDSCFYRLSKMGIDISGDRRNLVVALYMRNAIIHNGGLINNKYLSKLNQSEITEHQMQGFIIGSPIPINYSNLTIIYNDVVTLCQNIFVQVSNNYFSITEPLKKSELTGTRQSLDLPLNPAENVAIEWVRKFDSPEEAYAELRRLQGLGYSMLDILLGKYK